MPFTTSSAKHSHDSERYQARKKKISLHLTFLTVFLMGCEREYLEVHISLFLLELNAEVSTDLEIVTSN